MRKPHTKEWKEAQSKKMSGTGNPMFGKPGTRKGVKLTQEIKDKMRQSNLGQKRSDETKRKCGLSHSGSKCHWWKGGVTDENEIARKNLEYQLWQKANFLRDNFECQKCGHHGGELCAHHINNFSDFIELRYAIDNGITMCKKCHDEFHKKYGYKNNTKGQLEEYLINNKL